VCARAEAIKIIQINKSFYASDPFLYKQIFLPLLFKKCAKGGGRHSFAIFKNK
jgi:hypothetical protein